jgi:beta-lactamase class C
MKFGRPFATLLALASLASCSVPEARTPEDPARLRGVVDEAILPVIAEFDIPGMAVALVVDGEPFFFNYGVASRESGAPVTERTLFEIGSASKNFTATLVAHALVLDSLSLDDHPGRFMPELRGAAIDEATVLHLGTYTPGGLPLQFPDDVTDHERMVRYYREWRPDAAPGVQRRYSNPSLGLFGHLAGLALGTDFTDAMETRLLPTLGLEHTFIRVPERAMPEYAWGYDSANQPIRVNPGMFDAEAYGIKTSAADMIRFVQANIDPSDLETSMRRTIEETQLGRFQVGEMVQGLGWEQYPYPIALERLQAGNSPAMSMEVNAVARLDPPRVPSGPILFNKTGSTGGFGAYVLFVPERKIGIVMLANRNYPNAARIRAAHEILARLAP